MRDIYLTKGFMPLRQGAIINGCMAENYPGKEVAGLIITPHCDLAHDGKVSTVHYLPVLNFDDWFQVEGIGLLRKEWKTNKRDQIAKKLKNVGLEGMLGTPFVNADIICSLIDNKIAKGEGKQSEMKRLETDVHNFFGLSEDDFKAYLNKDKINKLAVHLAKYQHHAYYLVENWDNTGSHDKYKIILLREVHHVRASIVHEIANGLYERDINIDEAGSSDLIQTSDRNYFFEIMTCIKSPFIEHIMQAFSYNFCRIGILDLDSDNISVEVSLNYPQK